MTVRHHTEGRVYLIEVPEGSWVERRSHILGATGDFLADRLMIPWKGRRVAVYADPPGVLPLLAREGLYGMQLIEEQVPAASTQKS